MIPNATIQADIIALLKGLPSVTSLLDSPSEVREDQYAGRSFGYPAIRVALVDQRPERSLEQCDITNLSLTVRCYAESDSSAAADNLAGVVNGALHRRFVVGTGWYGWLRCLALGSAFRIAPRLWRADVGMAVTVYPR